MANTKKTGIFYVKNPAGVVVMKSGREIARYQNVQDLVAAHQYGIEAINKLEERQEAAVASQYVPYPPDPSGNL